MVVEEVAFANAEDPRQRLEKRLRRADVRDFHGGVGRFEVHLHLVHPGEVVAEGVVDRTAVFDLVKVVDRQFQRRRHDVMEVAEVVVIVGVDLGKFGRARLRLHPDVPVFFAGIVSVGAGVQLRRARAFAVAAGVERPAVVLALDAVADDPAVAQLQPPVRAHVVDRGHGPLRRAVEADQTPGELQARGFAPLEFLAREDRVPVIEHAHRAVNLNTVEWNVVSLSTFPGSGFVDFDW